jgi:hypothetical protein
MSAYNNYSVLVIKNLLLYKIPYYYFGFVVGSTKLLLIFIFFLELYLKS